MLKSVRVEKSLGSKMSTSIQDVDAKVHRIKKAIVDEWIRLNPKFVNAQDGVWDTIKHAALETLHGFFAPLLLLKWLVRSAFKAMLTLR